MQRKVEQFSELVGVLWSRGNEHLPTKNRKTTRARKAESRSQKEMIKKKTLR